ncbi:MAG: hypothetical protein JWO67_156, partial [Streptosporangiaceae bacterium]|nr:hypothetical protein [Streptosporangiaceae bacterium]
MTTDQPTQPLDLAAELAQARAVIDATRQMAIDAN